MKLKYKRCKPSKRIYRNLALGILTFLIIATVLPVAVHPTELGKERSLSFPVISL